MRQPLVDEDYAVVARMAAGDRAALAELYASHHRALLAYLRLLIPDPGLAEEVLQDTLLAAWTGAGRFAGRSTLRGWLFGIARRRAHDALRRRAPRPLPEAALALLPSPAPDPEAVALARVEHEAVVAAIGQLPPIHQEVLALTFVQELSYRELADLLEIPLGTVQSRLSNARHALRALLRADGARP